GEIVSTATITSDPFVATIEATAPASGEDRWRAEVAIAGAPRTVTSHVFLSAPHSCTCVQAARSSQRRGAAFALAVLAVALAVAIELSGGGYLTGADERVRGWDRHRSR